MVVIGAEKLSAIIDWNDRNTCVLFGDGAGAAVLQNRPQSHGLLTACMGADGSKAELLCMPGGGSRHPATLETVNHRLHFLRMEGKETFKNAVNAMLAALLVLRHDPRFLEFFYVRENFKAFFDDKRRIMVFIAHNTDNGDGWEREGEYHYYFKEFSEKKAYPLGINLVVYLMTH